MSTRLITADMDMIPLPLNWDQLQTLLITSGTGFKINKGTKRIVIEALVAEVMPTRVQTHHKYMPC